MVKIIALYTRPADVDAFMQHYEQVHTPLVKRLPGLERLVLDRVRGAPAAGAPDYFLVAEMHFPDRDTLKAALRSPENQALVADLQGFAQGLATVLVTDAVVV